MAETPRTTRPAPAADQNNEDHVDTWYFEGGGWPDEPAPTTPQPEPQED